MEFVMGYNDMDHTARADVCRPVSEVEQIIADAVQAYQAYSKLNLSSRQKILAAIKSKLIPMVRTLISIPAGVLKINFMKYTVSSALGVFVWNLVFVGAGYFLGDAVFNYLHI